MACKKRKYLRLVHKKLNFEVKIFYMKYVKIIILAIMEVIAELYLRDKK